MSHLVQARPFENTGAPSRPEILAWAGLTAGAIISRAIGIGDPPLDVDESRRALEAWTLWREGRVAYEGGPLLTNVTSLVFGLFGAGDAQSRLVPTIAGVATISGAWLLRPLLGRHGAWWGALILVLCPPFQLLSRTVSPGMLVASLVLLLAACAYRFDTSHQTRWLAATLACGALGLAADQSFVLGLLTLVVAVVLVEGNVTAHPSWWQGARHAAPAAAGIAAVVAVLSSTRLLMNPIGFQAGLIDPLWDWTGDVVRGTGLLGPILVLLVDGGTMPLAAVGLADYCRRPRAVRALAAWTLLALTLTALVRQPDLRYLAQPFVPAALLAGLGAERLVGAIRRRLSAACLAVAVLAFTPLIATGFQVNSLVRANLEPWPLVASVAALTLPAAAVFARLALGAPADRAALAVFVLLAVSIWTITTSSRLLEARGSANGHLLDRIAVTDELRLVRGEALKWSRADPSRPITVDPSLRPLVAWALRDVPNVRYGPPLGSPPAPRLGGDGASDPADGTGSTLRLVVGYGPTRSVPNLAPARLWRWIVGRESLVDIRPYAILVHRPVGS